MAYRPTDPFSIPAFIFIPVTEVVRGVEVKRYPETGERINCSFRTFGGTESERNDLYSVIDTAVVETWFRPDIVEGCRLALAAAPKKQYEIIAPPENISMRNQYLKFKVQAVTGGA